MNSKKNFLERTTFFTGLLILTLLVGYLCVEIANKEKMPPVLEVHSVYQPGLPGNLFKIIVENHGGETAKEANIFFHLYQDNQKVESTQLKINYVPVSSEVNGWISFSKELKPTDSLAVGPITFLRP